MVPRKVSELVIDVLEVVDVADHQSQRTAMPRRARQLSIQLLDEVTLVVDAREAVRDRHLIDRLVILRFEVGTAQKFHDRVADFDLVSTAKLAVLHELVVYVRSVRRMHIEDVIAPSPDLDAGVSARDAVAVKDDVVLAPASDPHGAICQGEAFTQLIRARRVDHHEAILARSGRDMRPGKGGDPRLDFALHDPLRVERLPSGVNVAG